MTFEEKCKFINVVKIKYKTQEKQGKINISDIAREVKKPVSTIYDIVRSDFAEPKLSRSFSNEEVMKMRDMFRKNITCKEIASSFSCDQSTVRNLLNKIGEYENKFKRVKINPFAEQTDERDYWLGYLIADGCISSSNYTIKLSQNNSDKYHMVNYADFLNLKVSEHNSIDQYYVEFADKDTHKWFNNLGIGSNKSSNVNPNIPLSRHIIRGIFDGDGHASQKCVKFTNGSMNLLERLKGFFDAHGISYTLGKDKSKDLPNHNPCYDLRISILKDNIIKFYNLLYMDVPSHLYLTRKKNNIAELKFR